MSVLKSELFLNRELSLLKFNQRVLNQAKNLKVPLLEKLRFLEIFYSNMDEFFMKRVGSLKLYTLSPSAPLLIDNTTARYQLELIRKKVLELNKEAFKTLKSQILPGLLNEGFKFLQYKELSKVEKQKADEFFKNKMFPVLTPMAVDPIHPFPLISSLSLSLAIKLNVKKTEEPLFARIKIPEFFAGWIPLDPESSGKKVFLSSASLITQHLQSLFPKMTVAGVMPFRITRNIDIDNKEEEEDAEDLLEFIEEEIQKRKFAEIVRLEHALDPDPWLLSFLKQELKLDREDIYQLPGSLDYVFLKSITNLPLPLLKYKPFQPFVSPSWLSKKSQFELISKQDRLVLHPFESFSATVEQFIVQAALDPQVLAVKMTLYRTDEHSPIVEALITAARAKKQVVCVLELKARLRRRKKHFMGP